MGVGSQQIGFKLLQLRKGRPGGSPQLAAGRHGSEGLFAQGRQGGLLGLSKLRGGLF